MCVQHPHLSTSPDTLSHCLGHLSGSLPSSPSCSVSQHRWDIKNVTASQAGAGELALCKTPCRSVSVTPCGPSTLPGLETGLCSDLSGSQDLHSPWAGVFWSFSPDTKPLCPPGSLPTPLARPALSLAHLPSFFVHDSIPRSDSLVPSLSWLLSLSPHFSPAQSSFPNEKRQPGLQSSLLPSPTAACVGLPGRRG